MAEYMYKVYRDLCYKDFLYLGKCHLSLPNIINTQYMYICLNVIGFIDNKAPHTVVIGAHYDHLGYGAFGSLHAGEREIFNAINSARPNIDATSQAAFGGCTGRSAFE